jgi:hypothetical protein
MAEMIFERPNCALGSIATMQVQGDKLEFNVIVVKELFEATGGFIVQLLQARFETGSNEAIV